MPLWQPLASVWQPLAQGADMALRTGEKRLSLHCRLGLWRNGRSDPDGATDIAAGGADPSAFYVGADGRAVTGGRLTAEAAEGVVTIRSNRLSEKELRRIFAAFLPEAQPE